MLVTLKHFLKRNHYTKNVYIKLKNALNGMRFYNRSVSSDTLCIVLAGYKDFFRDIVFERLNRFIPDSIDVCIVSSGLFSEKLSEGNPEVAKYLWERGDIPHIDDINDALSSQDFCFSVSPICFSIGAILFKRKTWQDMGGLIVINDKNWTGMGADEVQICSLAMQNSHVIIVSENTVVGHLSFGKQNEAMKEFFFNTSRTISDQG